LNKLADNVYIETHYFAPNVGCIVTNEGAVLVDSPFLPKDLYHWKDAVNKIAGSSGCRYIINTHSHFDHVINSSVLSPHIISSEACLKGFAHYRDKTNLYNDIKMFFPKEFEQYEEEFSKTEIKFPEITFSEKLIVHLGNIDIQLICCGGHTRGSTLVYVPSQKVLFCGDDIENNHHPAMGAAHFATWVKILQDIEHMDVSYIVPGHGEIGGKILATNMRAYFEEMIGEVKKNRDAGLEFKPLIEKSKQHMLNYLPVENEDEMKFTVVGLSIGIERLCKQLWPEGI